MFDIESARDFYAVLVADFDDFVAAPHSSRHAMHCAITAYHLHEWVWGEWLSKDEVGRRALGISSRDKAQFLGWIDRHCIWFQSVQDLANGSKHFSRTEIQTARIGGFSSAFSDAFSRGYMVIDFGEAAAEHRWMPALRLLEVVVRFWRDFFRLYLPHPDMPISKHHVD